MREDRSSLRNSPGGAESGGSLRKSPLTRSTSEGANLRKSPGLFSAPSESAKEASSQKSAVIMLHSLGPAQAIFTRQIWLKGCNAVQLSQAHPEAPIELLKKTRNIVGAHLFILEANFGSPGSEKPNITLIDYVLEEIKPSHLLLYSATEACLLAAKERWGHLVRIFHARDPIPAGFAEIPEVGQPRKLSLQHNSSDDD